MFLILNRSGNCYRVRKILIAHVALEEISLLSAMKPFIPELNVCLYFIDMKSVTFYQYLCTLYFRLSQFRVQIHYSSTKPPARVFSMCVYIAEFAAFHVRILSAFLRLSQFRRNGHQARALLARRYVCVYWSSSAHPYTISTNCPFSQNHQ